ncbi:hypothetical protein KEM60_00425 [Austwickia sp. TVS 96-490-7B]|uniref:hypothetical protein n=1 Tax=Austwickia sp. TVS 96-490-7B TaxID=2830843 RepID=UPI001C58DA57|nr:hypothetical protein [Austwickia sp. TVS 96-490-7B]MBW3084239.1 hypothetical protein [Austwickia sp. TVS 96-490-7B]
MRVTPRRPFVVSLSVLTVVASLFGAADQARADTGPSLKVAWQAPETVHEYIAEGDYVIAEITNTSDDKLTIATVKIDDATLNRDTEISSCQQPLLPGETCYFRSAYSLDGVDYPKNWDATMTVTARTEQGISVTGTDTHHITAVDDLPENPNFIIPFYPGVITAGKPLTYCLIWKFTRVTREPTTIVSIRSDLLGDMRDPHNPNIATHETDAPSDSPGYGCGESWTSTLIPAPAGGYQDIVHITVTDDEGNHATDDIRVTWTGPQTPNPQMKVTLSSPRPTLPETGDRPTVTMSLRNTGNVPLQVSTVTATGGRDLLAEAAAGQAGVTCTVKREVAPNDVFTCRYTSSSLLTGTPGSTTEHAVDVTASYQLNDPWPVGLTAHAATTFTFTPVPPGARLTLQGPSQGRAGGTATLKLILNRTTAKPITLTGIGLTSGQTPLSTTCRTGAVLSGSAGYSCTMTVRLDGKPGDILRHGAWATVTDGAKTSMTSADSIETTLS